MQDRRALLFGILIAGAALLGALLLNMVVVALAIAALQTVGAGGILCLGWLRRRRAGSFDLPAGPTPEDRVNQVLALNSSIEELARRVRSDNLQRALLRGCQLVPQILDYTRRHDADHLASTSAQIGTYLQSVHTVLTGYVEMQTHPKPDTPRRLHEQGRDLNGFPEFMRTSMDQLGAGQAAVVRANLKVLQPMTRKGIRG